MLLSTLPTLAELTKGPLASLDAAAWAARQPHPLLVFSRERTLAERTMDLLGTAGMVIGSGSWATPASLDAGALGRTLADEGDTSRNAAAFEIDGTSHVYAFPADRTVVRLGRGSDLDLTIDRRSVSKTHARFELQGGVWTLYDEGSTNGTTVDGVRVGPEGTMLFLGELIQLGTQLQLKFFNTESFFEQFREPA